MNLSESFGLTCWMTTNATLNFPQILCVRSIWKKVRPHFIFSCIIIVVVQSPSCVRLFVTPWTIARQASLSLTISWSLPKFMSIALVMPSNHLILCWHLLLLPSIFPSIRVFSSESTVHIRWPGYWSFSFSVDPKWNTEDWFPLRLTSLISLLAKGLSRIFSSTNTSAFCRYGRALNNRTWLLKRP